MHKFIITALLLLLILFAIAVAYLAIPQGFTGSYQNTLIQIGMLSGIIAFISAFLFHLLMTFLRYKKKGKYESMKAHLLAGFLIGFAIAVGVGLLSFGTRWQKGQPILLSDFEFFVFYPILGMLTGLIYKLVKD